MVQVNKEYCSKSSGNFVVLQNNNSRDVLIRFTATGTELRVQAVKVRTGQVKDPMHPVVKGVGYIGIGNYTATINKVTTPQYICWSSMITRAYCDKYLKTRPTYEGCTVCDEWHNFQVFAKWYDANYKEGCVLDKDIKVDNNKHYSPDTCLFVTKTDNSVKAKAKKFVFISPEGIEISVYNLAKFCRENELNDGAMNLVHTGKKPQYKGWTRCTTQR